MPRYYEQEWSEYDGELIVEVLREEQLRHDWTDAQMAGRLGMSRVYWTQLKNRRMRAGPKTIRKALTAFRDPILARFA